MTFVRSEYICISVRNTDSIETDCGGQDKGGSYCPTLIIMTPREKGLCRNEVWVVRG